MMSVHQIFVAWAYGIAAFALVGLVVATWRDLRRQHRLLDALEAKGLRRRRPADPGDFNVSGAGQ